MSRGGPAIELRWDASSSCRCAVRIRGRTRGPSAHHRRLDTRCERRHSWRIAWSGSSSQLGRSTSEMATFGEVMSVPALSVGRRIRGLPKHLCALRPMAVGNSSTRLFRGPCRCDHAAVISTSMFERIRTTTAREQGTEEHNWCAEFQRVCSVSSQAFLRSFVSHDRATARRSLTRAACAQLITSRARERWPSGRRRSPAKRVGVTSPSRVQIPPSPPRAPLSIFGPRSGGMAERTKATVLKTVEPPVGSLGSNPSPSARIPRVAGDSGFPVLG
jgi:hypothetical protein